MWNRRWLFWTEVFFWGSAAPEAFLKIPRSKTITYKFTQWPKQRWCKVIIVINYLDILNVIYAEILYLCLTQCLSIHIPVREFQSVQTWRSSRVINPRLTFLEKVHFALMTSHTRVIMRSHCISQGWWRKGMVVVHYHHALPPPPLTPFS